MYFLLNTVLDWLQRQLDALTGEQQKLVVVLPSWDSGLLLALGQRLRELVAGWPLPIQLRYSVAYRLGQEWRQKGSLAQQQDLAEIRRQGWYNEDDNLTGQRNQLPEDRPLLVVLAGAEHIPDRHSLQDFYHLDQPALWREALAGSTRAWVAEKFARALGQETADGVELASAVLDYLYERGLADLPAISVFLENLDLQPADSGQIACRLLLGSLPALGQPALSGLVLKKISRSAKGGPKAFWRGKCAGYLQQAQQFFSYRSFLSPADREKYLEIIQKLLDHDAALERLESREWRLGVYRTAEELLRAVEQYIAQPAPALADALRRVDFVLISDEILNYKPKKTDMEPPDTDPPPSRGPVRLEGLLPEVFLRAIWLTACEMKKEWKGVRLEDVARIRLQSEVFKHDFVPLQDEEAEGADERAQEFLQHLLGGIDGWLAYGLQLGTSDQELGVEINLCPAGRAAEELTYVYSGASIPRLEFYCAFVHRDGETLQRKFYWPLPDHHPCRLLEALLKWAYEYYQDRASGLPLFYLSGVNSLVGVRQDEEACRLLLRFLQGDPEQKRIVDLLEFTAQPGGEQPGKALKELAFYYQQFIKATYERGLFSALDVRRHSEMEYNNMAGAYLQSLEQCLQSVGTAGKEAMLLLYKAFLVVDSSLYGKPGSVWEKDLPAALVTPLHPVMLEMLHFQFSYLLECLVYLLEKGLSGSREVAFNAASWQRLVELAAVRRALGVVISGQKLEGMGRDFAYLQVLGQAGADDGETDSLDFAEEEMDEEDEDDHPEYLQRGRLAELVKGILLDYQEMHPYAADGLTLAVYAGRSLPQILAGVDEFLRIMVKEREEEAADYYTLQLMVYTRAHSEWTVRRWLRAWQQSWQQGDVGGEGAHWSHCRLTVQYRMVEDKKFIDLEGMLRDNRCDLIFLSEFFMDSESEFYPLEQDFSRLTENYRYFPVLEKVCCRNRGAGSEYKRQRVLTNHRFRRATAHARLVHRLQNPVSPHGQVLLLETRGVGDFQKVLRAAHASGVWVVCIDPAMDEYVITSLEDDGKKSPDIIGFGTGVGSHGEANFTISTSLFKLSGVQDRIARWVRKLFPGQLTESQAGEIARAFCRRDPDQRPYLSGLSLIKSTGPERFFHEFVAGSMVRLMLQQQAEEDSFCDVLVSLDAFPHWFKRDEQRPDFLHLKAALVGGRVRVQARLLECKLGRENEEHVQKAGQQLRAGLCQLAERFMPCPPGAIAGVQDRPDQRYWWLQLHRLIASHGVSGEQYDRVLAALELLSEGYFDLEWQAAAFVFWTDRPGDEIQREVLCEVELPGQNVLTVPVFRCGRDFIQRLCLRNDQPVELLDWPVCRYVGRELPAIAGAAAETPADPPVLEDDGGSVSPVSEEEVPETISPVPCGADETWQRRCLPDLLTAQTQVATAAEALIEGDAAVRSVEECQPVPQRILLGYGAGERPVYWEFGHPDLPNRHLLIFGASGTGKTYAIQCLLAELGRHGANSLIVDYTSGFTSGQLNPLFVQHFAPRQHVVRQQPLGINPFRRQRYVEEGIELIDNPAQVAGRLAGLLGKVYHLGEQQYATLYNIIQEGVQQAGDGFTLPGLLEKLREYSEAGGHNASQALSVFNKIRPFVDMNPLGPGRSGWEELFTDRQNRCHVIQLIGFEAQMAQLITEFVLLDLYWYYRSCGSEARPRPVVLDEVQNLDHSEGGSLSNMLREGRKFGLSLLLATQTLSNLKQEERDRLFQAAHKLFFRPADTELRSFASIIAQATGGQVEDWVQRLASLGRGECYSLGYARREGDDKLRANYCVKIKVTSLKKRLTGED
ncbi:ATP-binding protein [Desulfurispora thermophila]|uniref:ATP-binding protein n=1 Tax=Desulfurispora thermophila TaxID=265470 RepID=UPI0003745EA8|nr:ATP-binding protein [Desulfurispora thermophila]